ncbi:MAG: hypothetical protein KGH69_04950 [Candidatus Micrarchaeota archaeon]|nr:hypothetical protein [Candidatus Micrarchaeota archaeon]
MNQVVERDEHREREYARDLAADYPNAPLHVVEKAAADLISIDRMQRRGGMSSEEYGNRRDAVFKTVAGASQESKLRRGAAGALRR